MLEAGIRTLSSQAFAATRAYSRPWICRPCRRAGALPFTRRGIATTARQNEDRKPFYVTTPIFYVNAAPHVGHLYTMVVADILKRWQVLLGNSDSKLLTGTDEHGLKIQQAAVANKLEPQELCDQNHETFKTLAREANISNDHFIRTTDPAHKDAVRFFWENLKHRDYIYSGKHEGWYSVSEETFYPSSAVHAALNPQTGRKIMTSIETGKEVEWAEETNHHFRLSAMKDRLLEFYEKNPNFIYPPKYMNDVVREVSSGLQDLSISRPVERLSWGIPVPNDETQTIYVWLDALVNYLTYSGYPFTPGQEHKYIWPADVHVVGKDIIRFHGIYWPAFLLALDLPLPKRILTHGHWTIGREKMSKSTGNVVNPFFAMSRFGTDTMRWYLALNGGLDKDADYENSYIINHYKHGLREQVGNLISRVMKSKLWNVRECVIQATDGRLGEQTKEQVQHRKHLEAAPPTAKNAMELPNVRHALVAIMEIASTTNKYMQDASPWSKERRTESGVSPDTMRDLYNIAESMRIIGILMQPFMPEKAKTLLDMLGVENTASKRDLNAAQYGFDKDYGAPVADHKNGPQLLFPRLMSEM